MRCVGEIRRAGVTRGILFLMTYDEVNGLIGRLWDDCGPNTKKETVVQVFQLSFPLTLDPQIPSPASLEAAQAGPKMDAAPSVIFLRPFEEQTTPLYQLQETPPFFQT